MAKVHPRYADFEFEDHGYSEFPKVVYPNGTDPKIPADKLVANQRGVIVNNEMEEAIIRDGGTIVREGDEQAELQNQCERLGLKFDKRWGVERLKTEIAAAESKLME